jgi:hypothetical protein
VLVIDGNKQLIVRTFDPTPPESDYIYSLNVDIDRLGISIIGQARDSR